MTELGNRIKGLVVRAIVNAVKDSGAIQVLDLSVLDGENRSEIERVQNYGVTSNPPKGTKCVALAIGGNRERLLVIATDHEGRPINLLAGEVKVYNSVTGEEIFFKADGTILLGKDAADPVIRRSDLTNLFGSWTPVASDGGAALKTVWSSLASTIGSAKVFAK